MWVTNETMNHWLKLLDHARKIPNLDAYTIQYFFQSVFRDLHKTDYSMKPVQITLASALFKLHLG